MPSGREQSLMPQVRNSLLRVFVSRKNKAGDEVRRAKDDFLPSIDGDSTFVERKMKDAQSKSCKTIHYILSKITAQKRNGSIFLVVLWHLKVVHPIIKD